MHLKTHLLIVTLLAPVSAHGQPSSDIAGELVRMSELDQQGRLEIRRIEEQYGYDSPEWRAAWDEQNEVDAANLRRLEEIIAAIGWPKISEVGEEAAEGAFLIVQHAGIEAQEKYLSLFGDAVAAGEAEGSAYALLRDRVLMRQGKKQLYGSQLRRNEETGGFFLWPVEDEANVDKRRTELGMSTLEKSLSQYPFAIEPVPQAVIESFDE